MKKLSIRPRPCTDLDCRGRHSPRERVALAVSICEGRGVRMTELRRRVLELLWESGRPTGAYELIEAVKLGASRPVGPPTVYRALEFLMAQGLVSRIESLNAYVPCVHPERDHDCLFSSAAAAGHRSSSRIRGSEDCLPRMPPSLGLSGHVAQSRSRACVHSAQKPARRRRERGTAPMESRYPDGPSRRLDVSAATRQGVLA